MYSSPCERKAKDDCAWVIIDNLACGSSATCATWCHGECAGSDLEESYPCPDCATAWLAAMVTL